MGKPFLTWNFGLTVYGVLGWVAEAAYMRDVDRVKMKKKNILASKKDFQN